MSGRGKGGKGATALRSSTQARSSALPHLLGDKFSWTLCTVASFLYLWIFFQVSGAIPDSLSSPIFEGDTELLFGFCVWGPKTPEEENGCWNDPNNSHQYAFYVDVVMTLITGFFYLRDKEKEKNAVTYLAIAGIILAHGLLHWFLYNSLPNCYRYIEPGSDIEDLGYTLFAIFTFFLCMIILGFGFRPAPASWSYGKLAYYSAIITAVVVGLTVRTHSQWVLPALFAITHPLSGVTGLFTTEPRFSSMQGWAFLAATIVGIAELTTCPTFYRKLGGHVWYDVFLHTSIILSLPPFFDANETN